MSDKSDYLRSLTTETLPSVSVYKLHEIADYIECLEDAVRVARQAIEESIENATKRREVVEELGKLA